MSKITRAPIGLLDLFGSKTLGRNPNNLSDTVVGGFDITELTLLNRPLVVESVFSTTSTASLPVAIIEVPDSEAWVIYSQALILTPLAAAANNFTLGIVDNAGQYGPAGGVEFNINTAVGQRYTLIADWPKPFIVGPGQRFGCEQSAVVNSSFIHRISYRALAV